MCLVCCVRTWHQGIRRRTIHIYQYTTAHTMYLVCTYQGVRRRNWSHYNEKSALDITRPAEVIRPVSGSTVPSASSWLSVGNEVPVGQRMFRRTHGVQAGLCFWLVINISVNGDLMNEHE